MSQRAVDFLSKRYNGKLNHLGAGDQKYDGIYSATYDAEYIANRLNAQFLAGAETYAKNYSNHKLYRHVVQKGLELVGVDHEPSTILDIGSGAGNTVIPLLDMFPDSIVVASDLSIELLRVLRDFLATRERAPEIALMQLDAEVLDFQPNSFELVVGAAILHHLFRPDKTLKACYSVLRPGGVALFYEPMQSVNFIVRMLYSILLKDPRSAELPERLLKYIRNRVKFFDDRVTLDKSDPRFFKMDDKWMFPRAYLRQVAEEAGFSKFILSPMGSPKGRVRAKMTNHMVLGFATPMEALPAWFLEIVDEFDAQLPEHMAQDEIIGESMIVLVK